jgi:hypothetical protein
MRFTRIQGCKSRAHPSHGGSSESRRLIRVTTAHPSHGGSSESRRLIRVAEPGPCAGCACAGAAGGGCGWREARWGVTRPRAACNGGDAAACCLLWGRRSLAVGQAAFTGYVQLAMGLAIGGDASRGPRVLLGGSTLGCAAAVRLRLRTCLFARERESRLAPRAPHAARRHALIPVVCNHRPCPLKLWAEFYSTSV